MFFRRKKSGSAAESLDTSQGGASYLTSSATQSASTQASIEAGRGASSPNLQIATAPAASSSPNTTTLRDVVFEIFAPGAKSVSVAGVFNKWRPGVDFLRGGPNGKWSCTLKLPAGRYEYRYVVDGDWRNDQRPVESVPNPFGSYNSVVVVL